MNKHTKTERYPVETVDEAIDRIRNDPDKRRQIQKALNDPHADPDTTAGAMSTFVHAGADIKPTLRRGRVTTGGSKGGRAKANLSKPDMDKRNTTIRERVAAHLDRLAAGTTEQSYTAFTDKLGPEYDVGGKQIRNIAPKPKQKSKK